MKNIINIKGMDIEVLSWVEINKIADKVKEPMYYLGNIMDEEKHNVYAFFQDTDTLEYYVVKIG